MSAFARGLEGFAPGIAYHRPDTLARFEQAHQFQAANRISYGASADSKHLHQLPLGWEPVARLQVLGNTPLQLPGNFLVHLISWNRLEPVTR